MIFSLISHLISKKENYKFQSKDFTAITFWTAGIKYESRLDTLLQCKIKDQVILVREPDNRVDKNAIHIKTSNNKSLGYVGTSRAAILSALLDDHKIDDKGYIVALESNLENNLYGVKIALPLSKEIIRKFRNNNPKEIDYFFEISQNNKLYVLLNCDEDTLEEIKTKLKKNGVVIHREGISYRPSSSGKQFKWYLRLENNSDQSLIEKILRDNYPSLEAKYNIEFTEEYVELQEEKLNKIEFERNNLIDKVETLEKSLAGYQKRNKIFDSLFNSMMQIFLPNVTFIRDSIDILQNEVENYSVALSKIMEINTDKLYKAKKIKTLDKWFEIHFNTGQKDDGRIYFKRLGENLQILVSYKKSQKEDIEYLRKI